ncbi:uncharacterized protein [Diadema antillarum]|uniref:uncharacterized protein n=1 Tax=Diadema antillarum TaxID=105358 RepID=UPI003A89FE96
MNASRGAGTVAAFLGLLVVAVHLHGSSATLVRSIETVLLELEWLFEYECPGRSDAIQKLREQIHVCREEILSHKGARPPGVGIGLEGNHYPLVRVNASSISHQYNLQSLGLNSHHGAWCPTISDENQWLDIDLGAEMFVTGIALQGNPELSCWVTKYRVEVSPDGVLWGCVLDSYGQIEVDLRLIHTITGVVIQGNERGKGYVTKFGVETSRDAENWSYFLNSYSRHKVFEGNHDASGLAVSVFNPHPTARYLKIHIVDHTKRTCLRLEVYVLELCTPGNLPDGIPALGSKTVSVAAITASSSISQNPTSRVPLNTLPEPPTVGGSWCAAQEREGEWIRMDLGWDRSITGVVIQGDPARDFWVSYYTVEFSHDQYFSWFYGWDPEEPHVFKGSGSRNGYAVSIFDHSVYARYITLHPKNWRLCICLRFEVYILPEDRCPTGMVFETCGSGCGPARCGDPPNSRKFCPTVCRPGCYCPEGLVIDWSGDRCVTPAQCVNLPDGIPALDSGIVPVDSVIASSSTNENPTRRVPLDSEPQDGLGGSWCALDNNDGQWIEMDLGREREIIAVVVQGDPSSDSWVSEYTLDFANENGFTWYYGWEEPKKIQGSTSSNRYAPFLFDHGIRARRITLNPTKWNHNICLRWEVYFIPEFEPTPPPTPEPVNLPDGIPALDSGIVPVDSVIASSSTNENPTRRVPLDSEPQDGLGGSWCALDNNDGQWIEMDLGREREIIAVVVQGDPSSDSWVSEYTLDFTNENGFTWYYGWEEPKVSSLYSTVRGVRNYKPTNIVLS